MLNFKATFLVNYDAQNCPKTLFCTEFNFKHGFEIKSIRSTRKFRAICSSALNDTFLPKNNPILPKIVKTVISFEKKIK